MHSKMVFIKEDTKKYTRQGSHQFLVGLLQVRGRSTWGLSPDLTQIQTVALHLGGGWEAGVSLMGGVMVKSGVILLWRCN